MSIVKYSNRYIYKETPMNKLALSKREETKNRMIDAASRSFRQFGYGGIGEDGIAKLRLCIKGD